MGTNPGTGDFITDFNPNSDAIYNFKSDNKETDLNDLLIKVDAIRIQLELLEETYFQKINEIEKKLGGFKEIMLRIERKIDSVHK